MHNNTEKSNKKQDMTSYDKKVSGFP
jgi:hypothetical protein